jgi:uncharacterized membrane protein
MYADIARVTEHHLIALLRVRRSADVTDDILVILYAEPFLRFHNGLHFLPATYLQFLNHTLQLVFGDRVQAHASSFSIKNL